MEDFRTVKIIGLDADDTLWINETLFRETEHEFFQLVKEYDVEHRLAQELLSIEIQNLPAYGFGIKGFMLSMIETALKVSGNTLPVERINNIIALGKKMMQAPVELLPEVQETLTTLQAKYRLVLVTKGDLKDQERKLAASGLEGFFHHIEIVSDKQEANYKKLLRHLDISPKDFLMVGNSLKSDILPVVSIGAHAIHIPFHTNWAQDILPEQKIPKGKYVEIHHFSQLIPLLGLE